MRNVNRLIWSAVFALAVASPVSAQQGGGGGGGGGQGGGGQGGGGGGGGGQGGGGQGGGGMGTSAPSQSEFNLTPIESAPTISAPGTATTGGGILDSSNWLGPTFGNPYYQGIPANAKSSSAPGGFGSPLYGTSGGGGRGGNIGSAAAGGATGARGAAGGLGGRGGLGGIGGAANNATQFGTIVQPPVQISFSAVAKFNVAPVAATQLQTDLSTMISRSTEIANPAGIQVLAQGNTVTLRGTVRDEEEARTLVGMVRLTPGVHRVTNQLTFPRP